ncbi:MFS transporter [Algicella marina]|uniref:MFS transporter n=1 Tax=Algicella marina TaxID=2683284 RepID=A0A6P1T0D4_9RHOB|nr:MFS transporter [Algicella marina]QHQ35093.1 MFS transporter [Algicella marina]
MEETAPTETRARRNVAVLVAAQAFLGSQMPISFVLGGLSGQYLSPEPCLATLPISLIVFGSMLTAPVMGNFMQAYGRRAGFLLGTTGGALGGLLSVIGLLQGSFGLFLLGSLCTGIYMSAQGFYRFAATDTASDAYRPKAISYVMAGGLMSAIIGPQLVKLTGGITDPIPFAGGYMAVIALNVAGAFIFAFLDIPKPEKPNRDAPRGRTRLELLRTPRILVAMICAMVSYALMNLVMTSTPLAVVGCGYTTDNAADVVMAHVLAMFVPSFFTGHLIARFGAERIIATGLTILAAAGLVALNGIDLGHFYVTLVLLGLGWNFGFIGGTAMLASAHSPEERGRVQGMNDFAVFGMVTLASLSSGLLMNCSGGTPQEGWTAVNLAMIPFLALAGATLIWFALQGRRLRV